MTESEQNQILRNAEDFARERLTDEPTGHDYWHAVRVRNNARSISDKMQSHRFDRLTIELAALLHDVGDFKVTGMSEDDTTIACTFLKTQNLPSEIIEQIIFIIDNLSFAKGIDSHTMTDLPIEFQIVQDADRLDSMGAMGVARTFAYGGKKGRPLYDPDYTPIENITRTEYITGECPSLHHFNEKLFKVKDMLNTEPARKIAIERDQFMHAFYDQFLREWNGES